MIEISVTSQKRVAESAKTTAPKIHEVKKTSHQNIPTPLAKCACGGGCPVCQKKSNNIKISQPADSAEIEADQIADKVMRMPIGNTAPVASSKNSSNTIQRKCSTCEDDEKIIQRKPVSSGVGVPSQSPAHVSNAMSSGGRPLDNETRNFFEPRMGRDFGNVRVHSDSSANHSARAIDAKAYTLGNNIVFGQNKYKPESESGKHLLAHELAHVAQSDNPSTTINRQMIYRQPADGSAGDLAAIDYEIQMLSELPVMDNLGAAAVAMQIAQLQSRRKTLLNSGAGSSPVAGTTPDDRLYKAKELLRKTDRGQATLSWLAGYRKSPSALSASREAAEIRIELQKGVQSFYDQKNRRIILDENQSSHEMALSLIDLEHRTVVDPDPLKMDRDAYTSSMMYAVSSGAIDRIKFKRELQAQGISINTPVPLEAEYATTYNVTYAKALPGDATRTWKDIGPDAKRQAEIDAEQVVYASIKNNAAITGGTQQQYLNSFRKTWDQARAEQAQRDKENAEKSRVAAEKQAKIDAMANGLAEMVNKVNPESPEAENVIKLVDAVFPLLGGNQIFFIHKADKGLDAILGPFGYRTVYGVEIGGLQTDRLEYGLGNYLAIKPKDRARLLSELRNNPFAAQRLGIQLWPTEAELRAEGRLVAMRTLPDGSTHIGSLDEFKQAEEQNRINHALAQLEAISNAGPGALIGRIVDGERGAVIGAMIDSGLMVLGPMRARQGIRNQMRTMGDGVPGVPDARLQPLAIRQPLRQPGLTTQKVDMTNVKAVQHTQAQTPQPTPAPTLKPTAVPAPKPTPKPITAPTTKTTATATPTRTPNSTPILTQTTKPNTTRTFDPAKQVAKPTEPEPATGSKPSAPAVTTKPAVGQGQRRFVNIQTPVRQTTPVVSTPPQTVSAVRLRIETLADKQVIVGMQAKINVGTGNVLTGLTHAGFAKMDGARGQALGGNGEAAILPQVTQPPGTPAKAGNQPSAGMIVRPAGQSTQLDVLAWNTGAPRRDNNPSHAERQFIEWFNGQSKQWKDKVTSVDVMVIGRDICKNCNADIQWLQKNNPHIKFNWVRGD